MFSIDLQWPSFNVDLPTVDAWIKANAPNGYTGMSADTDLSIWYSSDPSDYQEAVQDYWSGLSTSSPEATNYTLNATKAAINKQILASQAFGINLMAQFETENVMMGITTDGLTEQVLDVMAGVMTALQSGSLTVAISRAKAIPSASYDSKYVTAARLLAYVNQIQTQLGVTLSTDLS